MNVQVLLLVVLYNARIIYSTVQSKATWDVAYNSCRLLSTDDIFEKYHRYRKRLPAWTKSTVILSDWTSFIGCVNKRSESVEVTDVKKELSEWFPDQKGPYHVKNIHECQYLCTIRPMEIRHLIYFRNVCLCINALDRSQWHPVTSCIGNCNLTDIFCSSGDGLPLFNITDSMRCQSTFRTLYQLRRSPVQCLSTQNILSCSSKQNVLCKNNHDTGSRLIKTSWYNAANMCFHRNTTLPTVPLENVTSAIWTGYFRSLYIPSETEDITRYEDSKRCIVALTSENKDSFLFKIAYCSEKYYVLCESEETDTVTGSDMTTITSSIVTVDTVINESFSYRSDILTVYLILFGCLLLAIFAAIELYFHRRIRRMTIPVDIHTSDGASDTDAHRRSL